MNRIHPATVLFAGLVFLAACATPRRDAIMLADEGRSNYRIVIAEKPSPSVNYAAQELQTYLKKITGARLPIVTDTAPAQPHEILVGKSRRLDSLGVALGKEGYVLRTVGKRLLIAGGEPRGTLYGVYGLLEDHFGCRWFTPEIERVPQARQLSLPRLNERKVPVFEYRETYTWESYDGNWMARNRLNGAGGRDRLLERQNIRPPVPELDARHGGSVRFGFGFFVHTFNKLVPSDQYFSVHPEYFALRNGKRKPTQLCCTNEDVIRLCAEAIRTGMRAQPEATVFSLSQSDNKEPCECDRCAALTKTEESGMGPLLHLVNRVAEAVEKEFPNKIVETLAYQWSRQPPKTMRPRPNVVIRLCDIECCFAHPLATGCNEANQKFVKDLQAWARVCNRLWIWDYTTNYSHYLLPLPNKRLLDDNIRLFAANHVTGVFEQGTYDTPDSEMVALKAYLIAKFLWNPNYNEALAAREFLAAYYGAAAPMIQQYLDLIHDYAEKQQSHVRIYAKPTSEHLTPELLMQANTLWDKAEVLVKDDAAALDRVRRSRMSVDYAIAEQARGQRALIALAQSRFPAFMQTFERSKLTRIREWRDVDKADYRKTLEAEITR